VPASARAFAERFIAAKDDDRYLVEDKTYWESLGKDAHAQQ
jgi:hypothetical protein